MAHPTTRAAQAIPAEPAAGARANDQRRARIAVFYPTDPLGHVPSGIDSVIRGVLKWAPEELEYTLFGGTSDPSARPIGVPIQSTLGTRKIRFLPIVSVDPTGARKRLPLTIRYMTALRSLRAQGKLDEFDILDFHRIEPIALFGSDRRPKNVIIHQDMAVLRNEKSDIMWRHAPWLYEWIEGRLFRKVDRVFCVRQSAVERYVLQYPELDGRAAFLPTWVDTTIFTPDSATGEGTRIRSELALPPTAELVTSVGRLDHQKDPLLLLAAFQRLAAEDPKIHLVLIGDGILRQKLEAAIQTPELRGRATLLGARPAPTIAAVLRTSAAFAMSSAYEGMPIALLEALATGTPVATTDVGEVRLVVKPGINGHIATSRTPEEFAFALRQTLAASRQLRGKPCTDAVAPYSPETVLAQIYDNHRRQAPEIRS